MTHSSELQTAAPGLAVAASPLSHLRVRLVLALVPLLTNCAANYVAPSTGPTAQLDLVSRIGGTPTFWRDDAHACLAEKLASFHDDTLQEIGALVAGGPLHPPQSHTVTIEAGKPFLITATFGATRCHASYSFMPRAGEWYEADARRLCVLRIIHITRDAAEDASAKREFEWTARPIEAMCMK